MSQTYGAKSPTRASAFRASGTTPKQACTTTASAITIPMSGGLFIRIRLGCWGGNNLYQYAPNPLDWIDPLGWWKGQPRGADGRFGRGKDPNKPPKPENTGNGNRKDNPNCTTLYKLVNPDGSVSKWGITSEANPLNRYSKAELRDRRFVSVATGSRMDMLSLERALTSRFGGAENKERHVNKISNSTSPEAIISAFKSAKRGCVNIL